MDGGGTGRRGAGAAKRRWAGAHPPQQGRLVQVRCARRFRDGKQGAVSACRADETGARPVSLYPGDPGRRQPVWVRAPAGLQEEVRGSLQAAPRCRGQVLRLARQSRRSAGAAELQAVQHGRQTLLLVQAGHQTKRAILRAREFVPRAAAGSVVRAGIEGLEFRLEDSLLPSPPLFVRRAPRIGSTDSQRARAVVSEIQRQRGVYGPRSLLRTDETAEGNRLLRVRIWRAAAEGKHR